jgi:hypothetical protein
VTIKNSLLLTRELLAAAGEGEPASMKEWLGRVSEADNSRAANRLRRDLGRRHEIQVFEQPEVLMLPDVAETRLENEIRTLSVVVKEMKGQNSFRAAQLLQDQGDGGLVFSVDSRQVWSFIRRDHARTYRSGMKLHRSMARSTPVLVQGRLVIHELTESPIAMEVDRMDPAG